MRRLLAQLAIAFVGFAACLQSTVPASARPARHAAMIIDANTGAVLHDDGGDEQRYPASLTKMMTLYLTFETIQQGRMTMSSMVTISQQAASAAPSKLDLDPGEEIAVRDAILALVTKSANDIAIALAEKIGGSERNFARLMNAKARELGMTRTNFENASGLPNPDQVTTARDMITLGLRLQDDFPQYYGIFSTRSFTFHGRTYRNHNTLMNNYGGIDGIKTGYTRASGFNLVTSVRRNGRHLVGAVFGGASAATRNGEMRVLLTRAFNRASRVKTRKPAPLLVARLKSPPQRAERPLKAKPASMAEAPDKPKTEAPPKPEKLASAQPQAAAQRALLPTPPSPGEQASRNAQAGAAAANVPQEIPQPQSPSEPASPEAAQSSPAPVRIVSKVRHIMVAPRRSEKKAPPNPAETTDMEATDPDGDGSITDGATAPTRPATPALASTAPSTQSLAFAAAPFGITPDVTETIVPKTSRTNRPALVSAIDERAALGAGDVAPPAEQAAAAPDQAAVEPGPPSSAHAPPVTPSPGAGSARAQPKLMTASFAPPSPADAPPAIDAPRPRPVTRNAPPPVRALRRGMPPSTLQAQAAAMSDGRIRQVAAADPVAGSFEIQIGAYASMSDAQRALGAVQSRAGAVVANCASVTQPIDKGGRTIYRARFRGFDANSAADACAALRKQAFDCFVMTAN
ncbi:MAG TPA: SPOR domain-containing protein [Hyphomicrobium sp.]|nr:SPOR domain-containing protein [Hyphomicrobium sp.]